MELALRICDLSQEEKPSAFVVIQKGFHGRTGQASRISDSCLPKYRKYLKSFQDPLPVIPIEMNNWSECLSIIRSVSHQYHIEAVIAEPIMGEGDPGKMMSLQFYRLLRRLTKKYNSKLIMTRMSLDLHSMIKVTKKTVCPKTPAARASTEYQPSITLSVTPIAV